MKVGSAASYAADLGLSVVRLHGIKGGNCTCGSGSCQSHGKHPDLPRWKHYMHEPADAELVSRWFREKPHANLGIITGEVSGMVVVDADGEEGVAELKRRGYPRTWTARSGSGARHLYLRHPGHPVRNRKLPGIGDLRGDGGLVVAPPSLHASGGRYGWLPGLAPWELSLAEPPGWLLPLLERPEPAPPTYRLQLEELGLSVDLSRLPQRIESLIREGNRGRYPSRSEADFAACAAMFRAGYGLAEVWVVMTSPNNGISEKFFEKGDRGEAYLEFTIGKALENSRTRNGQRGRPARTYARRKGGYSLG